MMNEQKLKDLAAEFAKGIKTEDDLNQFTRLLTKLTVETALNAELTEHLGHEKNAPDAASLGELLLQGKNNLNAPWLALSGFFSLAIVLALLMYIGEVLRDAFDPRRQ